MPGIRNREISLEVVFSVLIFFSLEQVCPFTTTDYSTTSSSGSECLPNKKNMAVYEREENTTMSLTTDLINKRWTIMPTSDELATYTISDYGGYREPTLTGLFYLNQHYEAAIRPTGRISTIQAANCTGQISTTQLYTATGPVSTTQPNTTIGDTSATQPRTTTGSISTTKFSNTTLWIITCATATTSTRGWNWSGSPAWQPISTSPIARSSSIYSNNPFMTGDALLAGRSMPFTRPAIFKFSIPTSEECEKNSNDSADTGSLFCSSPIIESSDELLEFDPSTDELIDIKGRNLSQGCLLRDYLVRIGNQICTNCNLQDNQLRCRPPKVEPSPAVNDTIYCGQHLRISITVGHNQYQYACLSYIYRSSILIFIVGLTVGLAGFALLLATCIPIVCIVRRRRKKIALSKICVHQNNRGQDVKNRVPKKAVQPKSQGDYGDMEHCYA